ncbi:hypothetical protein QUB08_06090 [Microcoleus sp. BR0-C5]|uniref:hypothetical protein n=1 Tax=Microcoleus sp. BR0-C5 TaxID=2818713 RepID=UPI002FD3A5B9
MTTQGFGVVHLYEKGYSYALSQWHGDAIDLSSLPDRTGKVDRLSSIVFVC